MTKCSVLRPDLSRIICPAIENELEHVTPVRTETAAPVTDRLPMVFIEKKSLPWFVISGIPRARAETTNLLSTSNCIRFGDFQRRRAGTGASAVHVGG